MAKKGLPWFRFYVDWLDNAKVQVLDATLQQRYIMLLCLRCKGEIPGLRVAEIAWHMRITVDECEETLSILTLNGLWRNGDVPNWDERQFVSDSSTDRSRKHRSDKKETLPQQPCNVAATPMQHAQSHSQIQISDTDLKSSPTPRKRGGVVGVDEVVTYLNQITGRSFALDRGNDQIERVLKAGATVQDCRDVLDRCWRLWHDKPEMVANVNKVTPFRKAHFDSYLDEARAGNPKATRAAPKPVEDDDPELTAAEREAARKALTNLGLGGMCNWT